MKIGTRAKIGHRQYEVVNIYPDGRIFMRPVKNQQQGSNGQEWHPGEVVRIVGLDLDELHGVVNEAEATATVTTKGAYCGMKVGAKMMRKFK